LDYPSNLERFLAGEPLNDELAALRDGRAGNVEPPAGFDLLRAKPAPDDDSRELTRDERQLLKDAKVSGVFTTLVRLQRKALQIHIRTATIESENDPLNTSQQVANAWAYVKMFRRSIVELGMLIDAELGKLEGDSSR
jgi:hypothetical protein